MSFSEVDGTRTRAAGLVSGYVDLELGRKGNRTVLLKRMYSYPYCISRAFYPDGSPQGRASIILQSASGTMNAGDHLFQRFRALTRASATLTTQGATSVHLAPHGLTSREKVDLIADNGAFLEYLPEIKILFAEAHLSQAMTLTIAEQAIIVACDGYLFHSSVRNAEAVKACHLDLRVVTPDGRLLFTEASRMEAPGGKSGPRAAFRAFGSVLVAFVGEMPHVQSAVEAALSELAEIYWSVSHLPNECGLAVKIAARDGRSLRQGLQAAALACHHALFRGALGMKNEAAWPPPDKAHPSGIQQS